MNISPEVNRDMPIAVDLVAINDKDLAKDVAKMTAADWFKRRDQIRQDFPQPKSITIVSWEWIPGQEVPDLELPMRKPPRSLLLFAHYSTPGPHRAKLDPDKRASVAFDRDDFEVTVVEKQPALAKSLAK